MRQLARQSRQADLRGLRAHAAHRRARASLLPERRGLRRRLPALPGHRPRARLGQGGEPDDADRSQPAAAPPTRARVALRSAPAAAGRSRRRRADPAPPVSARAADGRGGGHLQRERLPPHGRRHREEPGRAAGEHRPALRRQRRARRHRRLGHLLVPVPRHCRTRLSPCGWRSAGTNWASSTRSTSAGTRRSRTTAASCRTSNVSRRRLGGAA